MVTALSLNEIINVSCSKYLVMGAISLSSMTHHVAVTMPKELVESLTQKGQDLVREFQEQPKEEPVVQVSPSNTVEQLRMFKQLADEGIITAEEFESKKKQLLAL